jgi:hypothetical protein
MTAVKKLLLCATIVALCGLSVWWKIPFVLGWAVFHPEHQGKGRVVVSTPFPWRRLESEGLIAFEAFRSMAPLTGTATSSILLSVESAADATESDTVFADRYLERFVERGETATVTHPRVSVLCVQADHGDVELHCRSGQRVMLVYWGLGKQMDAALDMLSRARVQ